MGPEGTHEAGLERARVALEGLSVGDAFGEQYFRDPAVVPGLLADRALFEPPWPYTDDTEMALSLYANLREHGGVDPDWLAGSLARRYDARRGYGAAMHGLLHAIRSGGRWQDEAPRLFGGQGSFGNGAAMRVAPVGAYFADDLEVAARHAADSARVTHAHPDAIAGAVAVAVAAALSCRRGAGEHSLQGAAFIEAVVPYVPPGLLREKLRHARNLPPGSSVQLAVVSLGNGSRISAVDTVPFCLWCAAQHPDDYEAALWLTVNGLGDRDTNCAIVGGIVAGAVGIAGIPQAWREAREPLPSW